MIEGVGFNRLMLEMRAMQMDALAQSRNVAKPAETAKPDTSFADLLSSAVNGVAKTQNSASELANAFEMGDSKVDITDVMIASQKASISMQAATQVRNKMVDAYQSIMQMSI